MRYNREVLSHGSGLVIAHSGTQYLLTAAHNLTGKDQNGDLKGMWTPDEVLLDGFAFKSLVRLYPRNDEHQGTPLYVCDAARDVAIIKLQTDLCPAPLDESFLDPRLYNVVQLRIGDAGSLVGYPRGIQVSTNQGPLPIWKSVTIASEPAFTGPTQPLLIDSWGEMGLSGAPMFVEKGTAHTPLRRFVGIYTGRQSTETDEHGRTESLGRVTPLEVVMKIFYEKRSEIDLLACHY